MLKTKYTGNETVAVMNDQTSSMLKSTRRRRGMGRNRTKKRYLTKSCSRHSSSYTFSRPSPSFACRVVRPWHRLFGRSWWWCWHWDRIFVVAVVQIIVAELIQWLLVVALLVGRLMCCVVRRLRCILRLLLALTSLQLGLLEQSTLLSQPSPLLSILDLILPNQSVRRLPKDRFVLAEFAYPDILWCWWVLYVRIFLL